MRPDAAGDAIARDRECRGGRQRRVHRADDAVRDDHARSVDAARFRAPRGQAPATERVRAVRSDLRSEGRLGVRESACAPVARRTPARRGRLSARAAPSAPVRSPTTRTSACSVGVAPRIAPLRERVVAALVLVVLGLLCLAVGAAADDAVAAGSRTRRSSSCIDTSRSMLSRDVAAHAARGGEAGGVAFLDRAPDRLRVGLVTFAGDVSVAAFPTHDRSGGPSSPSPRSRSGRPGAARRSATRSCAQWRSAATRSARRRCRRGGRAGRR